MEALNRILGKLPKGQHGYFASMRRVALLRSAVFLGFSLVLTLLGRVFLRQYAPVFVICAVISAIPAAAALVQAVMYMRNR